MLNVTEVQQPELAPALPTASSKLNDFLTDPELKFLFVGGKGGVGKTTTSSSLAIHFATQRKVLLLSTDPAHSLGDAFNEPFAKGVHTRVKGTDSGSLDVLEVDPSECLEELSTWADLAIQSGFADETSKENILGLQNWLSQAPGIDEAMAISSVVQRMEEESYDMVVFDTAPTGHTLKLLQMPALLTEALTQLRGWQSTLWAYFSTFKQMSGEKPSESAIAARDLIEQKLENYRLSIEKVCTMIKNKKQTAFLCVCIAEHLSVQETKRMIIDLREKEIRIAGLVVNMLFPTLEDKENDKEGNRKNAELHSLVKSRRQIQNKYLEVLYALNIRLIEVLLQEGEVTGFDALERFSRLITKSTAAAPVAHTTADERSAPNDIILDHATVEIHGLSKKEYNGLIGITRAYDAATERYAIKVDVNGACKVLALRRDNLFPRKDLTEDAEVNAFLEHPKVLEAYLAVKKRPGAIKEYMNDPELGDIIKRTAEKMKPIL